MALGDGIRRNIAHVDPSERALLRDAFLELNRRFFPGLRTDSPPGGVSWWFKQDEIHHATHVHEGPEFLPWHREIVNRLEAMLRQINPQLSLHYWDWTQDPRSIPNANLGGGTTGTLNLFTSSFMGYGGSTSQVIGPPWQNAAPPFRSDGYYFPGANPHRDSSGNPADPPAAVTRFIAGSPATAAGDAAILAAGDFAVMAQRLQSVHDAMHGFVNMGSAHISFRDPFVFLLHSNVDRLFARWQTDPAHPERLVPSTVYGSQSGDARLNQNIRPWSGVPPTTRPWAPPENQQLPKPYKDPSVVTPPLYDTNFPAMPRAADGWVAAWGTNRLDIFGIGTDGAMFHKAWDGAAWRPSLLDWERLGGIFTSPPAVTAWGNNRLDIFGLGTDGAMFHKAWDGTAWRPSLLDWERLGGIFTAP